MTKEHCRPSPEGFEFTYNEKLFDRVSDQRLRQMLFDESTTIHRFIISSNNYGEFAFVTASRAIGQGRACFTFWGLGHHESRDRWLTDEWFLHRANQFPDTMKQELSREEAEELLQERQQDIAPHITKGDQSKRGQLFEMLADMTDEDGAYSEMQDLGPLFFDDLEDW
jgi:hypothetical protein